jgi:CheY-like chemotaxis protein
LSPRPELAATLHRLRSTLARMKAELELAELDGKAPPADRLQADLSEALELLADAEAAALSVVSVLVIDDDERLSELTARGLRRMGYEADSRTSPRPLRLGEIVVVDLGLAASLDEAQSAAIKAARPIVVTGAADPGSRAMAARLDASDYLLKPVELEDLAAAIRRRVSDGS